MKIFLSCYMCTMYLFLYLCADFMLFARGLIFQECENVEADSFVASWESCQSYVYCSGEESEAGDCEPGQYFDSEQGTCDLMENVACPLDEVDENIPEEEEPGDEEEIQAEDITTTIATNIETPDAIAVINIAPIIKATCPHTDDPNQVILMANNDSCTDYYLCYHGHAIEMHCTNQLHFNSNTGQCDFPEKAKCTSDRPNASKCLPHITDFFPHPENCNYFYYCIKGFLTVQQCPFYYGWDIERRSCVQISQAKCFATTRRTKYF